MMDFCEDSRLYILASTSHKIIASIWSEYPHARFSYQEIFSDYPLWYGFPPADEPESEVFMNLTFLIMFLSFLQLTQACALQSHALLWPAQSWEPWTELWTPATTSTTLLVGAG